MAENRAGSLTRSSSGGAPGQPRAPTLAALAVASASALLMLAFEALKELLAPGLAKWESHAVTIAFAGISSALVGFVALGRFHAVNRALRAENEDRKKAECEAREALEERSALFRELQHRVKNSFTMISSLVHLTQADCESEEARLLLSEVDDRIDAIAELYDMLHSAGSTRDVDLDSYLARILGLLARDGRIEIGAELSAGRIPTGMAVPIGLIVAELMTNALKYAFPEGRRGTVSLRALRNSDGLSLAFSDDGVGLPTGVDPATSRSTGLTIIRTLVDQLDGSFEAAVSGGTAWRFAIPLAAPVPDPAAPGGAPPTA